MNNQFKFRVWDSVNRRFLESKFNGISFLFIDVFGAKMWEWVGYFMNVPEYDVQSFTGLTDKNEKEIFDGDILRCKGFDDWFDEEGYYYNMKVEKSVLPAGNSLISGYIYIPKDCEVIGNFMENSDLLSK